MNRSPVVQEAIPMVDKWGILKLKGFFHSKDNNKLNEETACKIGEKYVLAMYLIENKELQKNTKLLKLRAGKLTQQIKVLASKPDKLGLIPVIHK